MLVLLPAEIFIVVEEKWYKKNTTRSFCSSDGKIIFALLAEVITGHVFITLINVRKTCLERTFKKVFLSHESSL